MIEMRVAGIALDIKTRSPIVLLKDGLERRALPIHIGKDQARTILGAIAYNRPHRPLTHDLITNLLNIWGICLDKIIIHSLKNDTFYAVLCVSRGEMKKEIDCRPSDAISLALRMNISIWVVEEVIANASIPVNREVDEEDRQSFRNFINNLLPMDLIQRGKLEENDRL